MARKSIKGYAEKNYYDNTRFTGGIVATNDPLNEGYFKHLVNFDISDAGQSITPRKGYLTTTLKGIQTTQDYVLNFHITVDDGDVPFMSISLDDPNIIKELCSQPDKYIIQPTQAVLTLTQDQEVVTYHILYEITIQDIYILFKSINTGIPEIFKEFAMDISNEGIIILSPLQDFNVQFTLQDTYVVNNKNPLLTHVLSKYTIYFYDESLGEYIFIDFTNVNKNTIPAWRVSFDIEENFITNCTHILNVDTSDFDGTGFNVYNIKPVANQQAIRIIDENYVTSYIVKVTDGNSMVWLKLYYRKDDTLYGTDFFKGNCLVVSYLNMSDIVDIVDTNNRNLASFESIVPDIKQIIYTTGDSGNRPDGHVNKIPVIYIKDPHDNFLINNTKNPIDGLTIIPSFFLEEAPEDYLWTYTYDITSYNNNLSTSNARIHKGNVYNLLTNEIVIEPLQPFNYYLESVNTLLEDSRRLVDYTMDEYDSYISKLYFREDEHYDTDNTLIIYMVPKYDTNLTPCTLMPEIDIDDNSEKIPDFLWMMGIHNVKITGDVPESEKYIKYYQTNWEQYNMWDTKYTVYENTKIDEDLKNVLASANSNKIDLFKLQEVLNKYKDTHSFYVRKLSEVELNYTTTSDVGYDNIFQTALNTNIIAFTDKGMSSSELYEYIMNSYYTNIIIDNFYTSTCVRACEYDISKFGDNKKDVFKLFEDSKSEESSKIYYLYTKVSTNRLIPIELDYSKFTQLSISKYKSFDNYFYDAYSIYSIFFKYQITNQYVEGVIDYQLSVSAKPILSNDGYNGLYYINLRRESYETTSLFTYNSYTKELYARLNENNIVFKTLHDLNYFDSGLIITFYLMKIPTKEYIEKHPWLVKTIDYTRDYFLNTTNLIQSKIITLTDDEPTKYTLKLIHEPTAILNSSNYLVFKSMLGDHLVVYNQNEVYISKENMPYYFTYEYLHKFPETIVKVIEYKDMLLVFTIQNLYAIYLYEDVQNVLDAEGNTVQQKVYRFASLPVLYNLMVDEKYKDAIQVYNQTVLFYSSDGQMFLIKPTAAVDSNTKFSIQYFNKSANDILLNYKNYMQDRLNIYGIDVFIEDVDIKVSADINNIKIIYNGYYHDHSGKKCYIITYILVYDVLNNRYYTYDTLEFNKVHSIQHIPNNELFITEYADNLYFTMPYSTPNISENNVDVSYYNNFTQTSIYSELDTGTINLNNHLKKRFKDLHVTYKNLNTNTLEFKLETFVDDIPIITYIDTNLDIQNLLNRNTLVTVDTDKVQQLVNNTALFNFMDYSSNKIITHKTNIISRGKTIRIKMNFNSKGKYKIQGYGLIYKEHTV